MQDAERWTFAGLDDAVRRLAGGLAGLGARPGSRVMIRMENTGDVPLLFFAALAAGYVAVPTSAQLTDAEARTLLADAEPAILVTSKALALGGAPRGITVLDTDDLAALKAHAPLADYAATGPEDPAFLVYTSGTSGLPKGVLHAHRSVLGRAPMIEGWLGIGPADTLLHAGAFNWTYMLGAGLMDPWSVGAASVFYTGPKDPAVWPRLMATTNATVFAAVPSLYRRILKYAPPGPIPLPALRHGLTAGEALSPALAEEWTARTGTALYEALGQSECSTYISSSPTVPVRLGSPGRPQKGRRVAILPRDGGETPLPPGETGLLAVHRSDPGLMLGYWRRPEEDAATQRGNWFVGGDLGSMDADGYVWFHGRADSVMNAFGYRVAPEEVEAALLTHDGIAEAGVTELAKAEGVSVIAAFVVPADFASPPALDAVRAHLSARLAAYKCPREIRVVRALPRTGNGKLIRTALKDLAPAPRPL